jgi:hypothetical protein
MSYEVSENGKTNRIHWLGKKLYIEFQPQKLKPLSDWSGNFVKNKLWDLEVDYLLKHACGTFFFFCLFLACLFGLSFPSKVFFLFPSKVTSPGFMLETQAFFEPSSQQKKSFKTRERKLEIWMVSCFFQEGRKQHSLVSKVFFVPFYKRKKKV